MCFNLNKNEQFLLYAIFCETTEEFYIQFEWSTVKELYIQLKSSTCTLHNEFSDTVYWIYLSDEKDGVISAYLT